MDLRIEWPRQIRRVGLMSVFDTRLWFNQSWRDEDKDEPVLFALLPVRPAAATAPKPPPTDLLTGN